MNEHLQNILNIIQQAAHVSDEAKATLMKEAKAADKELEITAFNLQRIEKVNNTTTILLDKTIEELQQKRKAIEAQNKELEIEAALERVRARAMAMHKSSELLEAGALLYNELTKLGIEKLTSGYMLVDEDKNMGWNYGINPANGYIMPQPVGVTFTETNVMRSIFASWKKQEPLHVIELNPEETIKHQVYMAENAINFPVSKEQLLAITPERLVIHTFNFEHGYLLVVGAVMLPAQQRDIVVRFTKVFEMTYTRFLDLQKAEAQAREAQIEAALERVRSRTMAMHRSEEIADIVGKIFGELRLLDLVLNRALIWIFNDEERYITWWSANPEVENNAESYRIDYNDQPVFLSYLQAWQKRIPLHLYTLSGDTKKQWEDHLFTNTGLAKLPVEVRKGMRKEGTIFTTSTIGDYGLMMVGSFEPLSDENIDIIQRFGRVFQQSYTRYLDVRKAEAQARESEIQLALERVRARTMAMYKSEELIEVMTSVFRQLEQLNFRVDSASLILNYKEHPLKFWTVIAGNPYPAELDVPYGDFTVINRYMQEKESDAKLIALRFNQDEKNEWIRHLMQHTILGQATDEKKRQMLEAPGLDMSVVVVKNTALSVTNYSLQSFSDEENEVLRRILIVFDQAYTRFLDLQKAEALAREAQIEAALERVRSRTTGMQKSEELRDVIQLVFEQLWQLGFNIDSAHFNLNYKESDDYTLWSAAPGQPYPVEMHIPYFDHPVFIRAREAKEKGLDFFTENYTQEEKNKFFEHLFKHIPAISAERRKYILSGKGAAASTVLMNAISLWVMNYAGIPYSEAENAILKRFGKIFEQSHTRFLDLQKAEAQALEAIKRASVDRVRAEIASMRTTKDLERITPLIWNELTTLGVPFIRCGVFIMDEEQQQIETHLSTPGGEAIATFNLPFDAPGETMQILAHWYKKELYKQHWDEAQFVEFTQNLVQQGAITSGEKYLTENRPANLYLHFLPFLQGMLYAGNTSPLDDDQLHLMQNLADAFSTAYARYEDFNKLEAAKKEVDGALDRLQATQKQLIQSEKMASLGELTAGIAHEIQNPLNFVNNFSEVNNELIDELVDEVDKGNLAEVRSIAKDIKQNEEKINHHGNRADAIVKGMLEHARTSSRKKEPTNINKLADEYLRLAYHGMRAKDKDFNAELQTELDESIEKINIVPQDIGRVLLNLYNNAFYAVNEKKKTAGVSYKPTVLVSTKKMDGKIEISVNDNGNGIPQNILNKIFQPFFTTKPTGQGTGLGLSLSYDIIKAHGGEIKVQAAEIGGSEFIVKLPLKDV